MIYYPHYKDLNKTKVSFSHCRVEQKSSKLFFTIYEWNKLNPDIRRIDSYIGFRKKLLSFIKPTENKTFCIYDPFEIKLLNGLRVDFSHLNEHKFRHNFADTLNPLYSCSLETETTALFSTLPELY